MYRKQILVNTLNTETRYNICVIGYVDEFNYTKELLIIGKMDFKLYAQTIIKTFNDDLKAGSKKIECWDFADNLSDLSNNAVFSFLDSKIK